MKEWYVPFLKEGVKNVQSTEEGTSTSVSIGGIPLTERRTNEGCGVQVGVRDGNSQICLLTRLGWSSISSKKVRITKGERNDTRF